MLTTALVLVVSGLVIGFSAFLFAVVNMMGGWSSRELLEGFGSIFKGHLAAMAVMAIGGFLFLFGLIIGGWQIVQQFLH